MSKSWPSSVTDTVFACARTHTLSSSLLYWSTATADHDGGGPGSECIVRAYVQVPTSIIATFPPLHPTPILFKSAQAPILSNKRHLTSTLAMKLTIAAFLALAASAVALPQWWGGFSPIGLMCGGCQKSCADLTRMEGGDLTTCLRKNCPPNVRFLTLTTGACGLA